MVLMNSRVWWQKNWPRTYTQLEQKQEAADSGGAAYEQDWGWFQAWITWQRTALTLTSSALPAVLAGFFGTLSTSRAPS